MKEYKKPLVTVDAGLAEGVYSASGAGDAVKFSDLTVVNDWGGNGQLTFTADLSGVASLSQLTLVVTFNQEITGSWGGGASATVEGKTAKYYWYSAPNSAGLIIQVGSGLSTLKIEGYSYYNS